MLRDAIVLNWGVGGAGVVYPQKWTLLRKKRTRPLGPQHAALLAGRRAVVGVQGRGMTTPQVVGALREKLEARLPSQRYRRRI